MAIDIHVYALPGTEATYFGADGEFMLNRAKAATRDLEPILRRRLTHMDPRLVDGLLLARTIAGQLVPPHHEDCVMYVQIRQDGAPHCAGDICFGYTAPPATSSFEKVAEARR
jgi:hypothetical protein